MGLAVVTTLLTGFEQYYRPTPENLDSRFDRSVFVLDTNVLLNILRFSAQARKELIEAIRSVAPRTFVPHQVAVEYNRNRVAVVAARRKELDEVADRTKDIRNSVSQVTNLLRRRRMVADDELRELEEAASAFLAVMNATSREALEKYDLDPDSLVGVVDPWTNELSEVLSGRVALAPSADIFADDLAEAERRKAEQLAPGFKDDAMGDYLWWAEALRWSDLVGKHLVVVSDDATKGDWRHEERSIPAGPHPILADDARNAGAASLTLLTTGEFLTVIERRGQAAISESTIAESEQVGKAKSSPWTLDDYLSLLATLEQEGYEDRIEVIREAGRRGGSILRSEVYQLADMSEEDRSLRQFATPAARIARRIALSEDGDRNLIMPLSALYEGPGKAVGYEVPPEFVEFERVLTFLREMALEHSGDNYKSTVKFPSGSDSVLKQHLFGGGDSLSIKLQSTLAHIVAVDAKRHALGATEGGDGTAAHPDS